MTMPGEYDIATKCLHLKDNEKENETYGALSFPIYQTATFAHKGVGKSTGYDYTRMQNPTRSSWKKLYRNWKADRRQWPLPAVWQRL